MSQRIAPRLVWLAVVTLVAWPVVGEGQSVPTRLPDSVLVRPRWSVNREISLPAWPPTPSPPVPPEYGTDHQPAMASRSAIQIDGRWYCPVGGYPGRVVPAMEDIRAEDVEQLDVYRGAEARVRTGCQGPIDAVVVIRLKKGVRRRRDG